MSNRIDLIFPSNISAVLCIWPPNLLPSTLSSPLSKISKMPFTHTTNSSLARGEYEKVQELQAMGLHHQAQYPAHGQAPGEGAGNPALAATCFHKDDRSAYHAQKSVAHLFSCDARVVTPTFVPESRLVDRRTPTKLVVASPRRSPLSSNEHILNIPQYVLGSHLHVVT